MARSSLYPSSITPGIPKIRCIPDGWILTTFGELLAPVKRPVKMSDDKEYQLVIARRSRGGIAARSRLLGKDIKTKNQFRIHDGDFLIAKRQIIHGACGIVPAELDGAIVSGEYAVLEVKDGLLIEFLRQYTHSIHFQQACFHSSVGVDVEKMIFRINEWYREPVCIPPLPEQVKIAEILSNWDKAMEQTERLIEALKKRKKGLMQQLLTGEVRFPEFADHEWLRLKLGDVFNQRKEKGYPELPLLSVTDDGIKYRESLNRKDTSNADKSNYLRICPGDIGYNTMRMWQGRSALSATEGIVSPAYTIITPKTFVDGRFMACLFKFQPMVHTFWRHSQGLVSDTLSLKYPAFSKIMVELPSIKEQRRIADLIESCDSEIDLLHTKLSLLSGQKKGLMQRLLTGQARVKVD